MKDPQGLCFSLRPCWSVAHMLAEDHVDVYGSYCHRRPGRDGCYMMLETEWCLWFLLLPETKDDRIRAPTDCEGQRSCSGSSLQTQPPTPKNDSLERKHQGEVLQKNVMRTLRCSSSHLVAFGGGAGEGLSFSWRAGHWEFDHVCQWEYGPHKVDLPPFPSFLLLLGGQSQRTGRGILGRTERWVLLGCIEILN